MELSDLWLKMAKNENLTPQELDFLARSGRETQQRNTSMADFIDASGGLLLNRPKIKSPFFLNGALSLLNLARTTNTAITTGTDTAVSFESVVNNSDAFYIDVATPTKVRLVNAGNSFAIMGKVGWESNATGYRNAKIEAFDINGASLGTDILNSHAGWAGNDNVFSFVLGVSSGQFPTMHDFSFTVGHTRGSNLNLLFFAVSVFVI